MDSLGLALKSKDVDAEVIVFCGVRFMADCRYFYPDKRILIPNHDALCPMAAQLTPDMMRMAKHIHHDATVVLYEITYNT